MRAAFPNVVSAAPEVSQTCAATNDLGLASHGACVSILESFITNRKTEAVGICKALGSLGFKNQGECVTTFRRLGF
jgi:hypothetical protein